MKFMEIRSLKEKRYLREVDFESKVLQDVKRMRGMAQDAFDREVQRRESAVSEKRRIRKLDKVTAEREARMIRDSIDSWTVQELGVVPEQVPVSSQASSQRDD